MLCIKFSIFEFVGHFFSRQSIIATENVIKIFVCFFSYTKQGLVGKSKYLSDSLINSEGGSTRDPLLYHLSIPIATSPVGLAWLYPQRDTTSLAVACQLFCRSDVPFVAPAVHLTGMVWENPLFIFHSPLFSFFSKYLLAYLSFLTLPMGILSLVYTSRRNVPWISMEHTWFVSNM